MRNLHDVCFFLNKIDQLFIFSIALVIIPKEKCLRFQNLNRFVPLCTVVGENDVRLVSVLPLWRFLLLVSLDLPGDIDGNQCAVDGICRNIFLLFDLTLFVQVWF